MPADAAFIACARVGELEYVAPESVTLPCEDCQHLMHVHPHSIEIKLSERNALIICNQCARKRLLASDEPPILVAHPLQEAEFGQQLRERFGAVSPEEAEEIAKRREGR